MFPVNLIFCQWLPVRFKNGATGKLAPVDLADENVVDIAATRADLQGAAWQFLLGLLQSSIAPKNYSRWEDIWEEGLTGEMLHKALAPLGHAFHFGAESPSFMQDFEPLAGEKVSIASLLPEIPGAQTIKFNKDHFIKRGVTERLCPHCAALALFSLQLNAPSGGKGYRTGLRGGGPLTTLIELQEYKGERQTPLWRKLWLNVMPQDTADLPLPAVCDASVFPWLAATRTSEPPANTVTTPEQVNKLQMYWGMPRRIRLDFATTQTGLCDICGVESDALLGFMTVKNYGVNYDGWRHPLTPYRAPVKDKSGFFSVKLQPGGLIWRDWLGLNQKNSTEANEEYPAQVVNVFNAHKLAGVKAGLWGFGADFDNMKIRCWYEHHFPLLMTENLLSDLRKAVQTAARLLSLLRSALKEAWFASAKDARGDFSFIDIDFWNLTQGRFLHLIHDLETGQKPDERLNQWQRELWLFTRRYFDDRAFTNPYENNDLQRIMAARRKYFTTSAEKQSAKAAREKKQEAAE
ncbi:type I-E CRISPR-associated protein Cse1/CasA [Citrobacter rodentium]|uniref:CRISPR-associated protein n=2 Tax=Citrobacter rodentium TaxID=67825 RepID=D2TKK4_CITRI|nr:type I-E CRISPR-associated protein Cse1/CasA [Citrobacter rodentium]KIQ51410.1 CRISPR-associated protein CasA [Citrobacter rodentium]QBY29477.1 type I-E CRISPR-associated protein Cse1/CasA [Citrobacter rodentium]UHO33127.1 type I-E CRISPR-associated protein Cse1/CasA [Citrobacter rodentium NBRC 105723 = DSM 16636]CBG89776.1 CRISPR-associated protein [Citrobacter rodentium ICC168]HAT8012517.1 type I-E CRISPR-associated protein Cse1/CasA [Citrobacter rodentium NBRC 105723 = DSM 16636]